VNFLPLGDVSTICVAVQCCVIHSATKSEILSGGTGIESLAGARGILKKKRSQGTVTVMMGLAHSF
jgi:hypothetical protein